MKRDKVNLNAAPSHKCCVIPPVHVLPTRGNGRLDQLQSIARPGGFTVLCSQKTRSDLGLVVLEAKSDG